MIFRAVRCLVPSLLLAGLFLACGGGSSPTPPPTYTVTFVAGSGGTLTGTTSQTITSGGNAAAVTAVPSSGYAFTNWTGTGFTTNTSNPLVVSNVTGNLSITANFTLLPATSLSYTDPTAASGVYLLKKNAASTSTHLVLDVWGPTTGTGNGLSVSLVADTSKVTWVDVPVGGSTSTLVQNGTQFNLGTGVLILKAKATGTGLQATIAQKGATAASLNGVLLRVALDLKAGLPVGVVSLSAVAPKCQLLDASGNIATITLTPGILTAQ